MMRLALTESAAREVDEILEGITSRDGLERALHVADALESAFRFLCSAPNAGTTKPHVTDENVRWWTVFNYVVMYRCESEVLNIVHVLHGARDLGRMLSEEAE